MSRWGTRFVRPADEMRALCELEIKKPALEGWLFEIECFNLAQGFLTAGFAVAEPSGFCSAVVFGGSAGGGMLTGAALVLFCSISFARPSVELLLRNL